MWAWLGEKILALPIGVTSAQFGHVTFALFFLLSIFLCISRWANGRLSAPSDAPRFLQRLAQAAEPVKSSGKGNKKKGQAAAEKHQESKLLRFLLRADTFFHEKLKWLPDAKTGRRVNFLLLLVMSFAAYVPSVAYLDNEYMLSLALLIMRSRQTAQATEAMWQYIAVLFLAAVVPPLAALFLVRKNREFYFDVFACFVLLALSLFKLLLCWSVGCCSGLPSSWGRYDETVGAVVFPIQLIEGVLGVLLFVCCFYYLSFAKSYRPGRGCALALFSYLVPRFFWDFFRYREEGFALSGMSGILGMTKIQLVCVLGILAGIAWLFLLPLVKKILDAIQQLPVRLCRRLAARIYYSRRLNPFLARKLPNFPTVFASEEVRRA